MSNPNPTAPAPTQGTPDEPTEPTHRIKRFAVVPRSGGDDQAISMPKGAEIIESLFYEARVYIWAKCPIEAEEEDRMFRVFNDDAGFADDEVKLVAFAVRPNGKAIHVAEVVG